MGPDIESSPRDDLVVRVPVFESHDHAGAVRDHLIGRHFASATEIVVLQDGRPVALVPIEAALSAAAAVPIGELAQVAPTVLRPGGDEERALREAVDAGNRRVVVVDEDGRFEGLLPPTQLLVLLAREHDEDLARLGGFLATTSARAAVCGAGPG